MGNDQRSIWQMGATAGLGLAAFAALAMPWVSASALFFEESLTYFEADWGTDTNGFVAATLGADVANWVIAGAALMFLVSVWTAPKRDESVWAGVGVAAFLAAIAAIALWRLSAMVGEANELALMFEPGLSLTVEAGGFVALAGLAVAGGCAAKLAASDAQALGSAT